MAAGLVFCKIGHIKGHETDWMCADIDRIDVGGLVTGKISRDSITARSATHPVRF